MIQVEKCAFAEVPRIGYAEPIVQEAAQLLAVEIGQKCLREPIDDPVVLAGYADEVSSHSLFVAATEKAKIIGAATLIYGKQASEIGLFAVEPMYRLLGVGSKLLQLVEQEAARQGSESIILWPSDGGAQFCLNRGFVPARDANDEYMMKSLVP